MPRQRELSDLVTWMPKAVASWAQWGHYYGLESYYVNRLVHLVAESNLFKQDRPSTRYLQKDRFMNMEDFPNKNFWCFVLKALGTYENNLGLATSAIQL